MAESTDFEGFETYLLEREYSRNTVRTYLRALEQFSRFAQQPDKLNLLRWKEELIRTNAPASVNLKLSAMRSYCRYKGVSCDVRFLKTQHGNAVDNIITLEEYERLISGLIADGRIRWAAYYRILGMSGVRISELLAIRKQDVKRGCMDIFSKGKARRILFPAKLAELVLPAFEELGASDFICVNARGDRLTQRGVRKMLREHAECYGIPPEHAHPHSFRHLFAIEFLKRNPNIALLGDLLGHSSVQTTSIYLRLSHSQQQEAVDQAVTW